MTQTTDTTSGKMNLDEIKELIYFAREEVAVCLDVVNRLIATSTLGEKLGDHTDILRYEEYPEQYRPYASSVGITEACQMKMEDMTYFCDTIQAAHEKLKALVDIETSFYKTEAIQLRAKNWFVQEKLQGPFRGELFINYGYRHDGSVFNESTEAFIWRNVIGSSNDIQLLSSHRSYCYTFIQIFRGTNFSCKFPIEIENDNPLLKILLNSRRNCYEKELFHKIMENVMADKLLMNSCQVEKDRIIISLRYDYSIIIQLGSSLESDDKVDFIEETVDETLEAWNITLNLIARSDMMTNYSKLKRFEPEENIAKKMIKFVNFQIVQFLISERMDNLKWILSNLLNVVVDMNSYSQSIDWVLHGSLVTDETVFLKVSLDDELKMTLNINSGSRIVSVSSISDLEALILLNLSEFVSSCIFWEAVCYFGKANVLKSTSNSDIQVIIASKW